MKKFILFLGTIYVFTLISFNDPNEKPKSFSEIINNDPSRIKELLATVDSLSHINQPQVKDKITKGELESIRKNNHVNIRQKDSPTIKVRMDVMKSIMNELEVAGCKWLVFYIGSYKNRVSIDRYNARNGTNYGSSSFNNTLTFIIAGDTEDPKQILIVPPIYYDPSRICPPPSGGGCD